MKLSWHNTTHVCVTCWTVKGVAKTNCTALRRVPPEPVRRKQGIREPEELTEARNQLLQPNYFGLVKI